MPPNHAPRLVLPPSLAILVVTLLSAAQPVSIDFFLPALPALRQALGAPLASAPLTLSVLMMGFGISQLVLGPAADRFGRRPIMLLGLGLYCAGTLVAALAWHMGVVIAGRTLQGIGLAGAMVCSRALMRDLYQPGEGTRLMTLAMAGMAVISMVSPLVGGLLTELFGWRANLAGAGTFAAAVLALVAWRIPETLPARQADALQPRLLLANYLRIARHPVFLTWTGLTAASFGAVVGFWSVSSQLFVEHLQTPRMAYAGVLAGGSISFLAGTWLCRRRIPRVGIPEAVRRAGWVSMASVLLFAMPQLTHSHTALSLTLATWCQLFAYGTYQPCGQIGMVSVFPHMAGAASALGGAGFAAMGFASSSLLSALFTGDPGWPVWITATLIAATALISQTLVQRLPR